MIICMYLNMQFALYGEFGSYALYDNFLLQMKETFGTVFNHWAFQLFFAPFNAFFVNTLLKVL